MIISRQGLHISLMTLMVAGLAGCGDTSNEPSKEGDQYLGAEAWPKLSSPVATDEAAEELISVLIASMSIEEKVGQIMQTEIQFTTPEDVRAYHLGSVLNGGGSFPNKNKHAAPSEWLAMADAYYLASVDDSDGNAVIPILWGSDAVHGHSNVIGATLFPHNIGLGAMRNPELVMQIGNATAREMRVTGIDWTFAPTLAVAQDDRWGRTYESYSEDPAVVRSYADQMVYGIQGMPDSESFLDSDHAIATAKHFVADGGTTLGIDQGDAAISEEELRDIHAQGYMSALPAGVQTVMASFSSWNGEKMHGSHYLLTEVLKDQMGFDGFIVGDWNGHGQLPGCDNVDCSATINAGLDMYMASSENWKELHANTVAQVKSGELPMARLDDAVRRILRVKIRAGLFEKGRPSERGIAGQEGIIGSDTHRAIARQAVRESLVLIKNADGILPLNPVNHVLVTGDGAHNIGKQAGGWTITWQGTGNTNADFPGATSIYDGIAEAVETQGGTVEYSLTGSFQQKPDVAIVVFGEDPYAEFQGDRETLEFEPGAKRSLALMNEFKAQDIPVVAVLLSGRPLWTNPEINASNAFVAAWLPGSEGAGVADVLIADAMGNPRYDFKGTLSFSWPKTPVQGPLNFGQENYDPLFALGYGLNYANGESGPGLLEEEVEGVFEGEPETVFWYNGRPPSPWIVFLGDDVGSGGIVSGANMNAFDRALVISTTDRLVQEDARKISWERQLEVPSGVKISGPETDLSRFVAEGILSFYLKVDEPLQDQLALTVANKTIVLDDLIADKIGQGWQNYKMRIGCFAPESGDFSSVSTVFGLSSRGPGEVEFSTVSYEIRGESNIACE